MLAEQKWGGDITYSGERRGFGLLGEVSDLFWRKVIGWAMSDSMTGDLVGDTVKVALWCRRRGASIWLESVLFDPVPVNADLARPELLHECQGQGLRQRLRRSSCHSLKV